MNNISEEYCSTMSDNFVHQSSLGYFKLNEQIWKNSYASHCAC